MRKIGFVLIMSLIVSACGGNKPPRVSGNNRIEVNHGDVRVQFKGNTKNVW